MEIDVICDKKRQNIATIFFCFNHILHGYFTSIEIVIRLLQYQEGKIIDMGN